MMDLLIFLAAVIRLTSGQRLKIYRLVESLLPEKGAQVLRTHLKEAIAHDERTRALEDSRRASGAAYGPEVKSLDGRVDGTLGSIRDMLVAQKRGDDINPAVPLAAAEVLEAILPNELKAVTQLPYVDEAVAVQNIVQTLESDYADEVVLLGLSGKVAALAALAVEYRDAVDASQDTVEAAEIREADRQGHIYLLEMVSIILGTWYNSRNPEHVAIRTRLLAPLHDQMDITRGKRRARRAANRRANGDLPDSDLPGDDFPDDELPGDTPAETGAGA